MSSGHLAVLVATDTPDTTDLLDVVNFLQYAYFGGKSSTAGDSAAPSVMGATSKDAKSRAGRAESTAGVKEPTAAAATPDPPQVVVFEKCGLGENGQPMLEGTEMANALLVAMEKAATQVGNNTDNNAAALSCFSPSGFASPTMRAESTSGNKESQSPAPGDGGQGGSGNPVFAFASQLNSVNIPRVIVVGCPSMAVATSLVDSGVYAVSMVLTFNSVEPFPQVAKLQDAAGGKGGKKVEVKKAPPPKKGEVVKVTGSANVAARLQAEMPSKTEVTQFATFEIGNAALTEAIVGDAVKTLKGLEASFSEYVTWKQTRKFAPLIPLPANFSLATWTRLRAGLDLVPGSLQTPAMCSSATRLLTDRRDGWTLVGEVQRSLVTQVQSRCEPVQERVVQLVDMDAYARQIEARQDLLAKIQVLKAEYEQQLQQQLLQPESTKKSEKSNKGGGKEGASPGVPTDGTPPVPEVPPPEPLPTIGYPFVVEVRPPRAAAPGVSEDEARWVVRQFVKRSLGRLDAESDSASQIKALLASSSCDDVPPGVSAASESGGLSEQPPPSSSTAQLPSSWTTGNPNNSNPLLEASVRNLYDVVSDHAPSQPSETPVGFEEFPTRSRIIFRATQDVPELVLKESEPTIRDAIIRKVDQTHTTREKNFALVQTVADQVLRENFTESAVPLWAHQYVETIDKQTVNERLVEYLEHHGTDVTRLVRLDVSDDPKADLLTSTQGTRSSKAVVIAAVDVPPSRTKTFSSDTHLSGIPSFTQVKQWQKLPDDDVRKRALMKTFFSGRSPNAAPCFVSDQSKLVFPYDGSVVRVHIAPLGNSRSVTYTKADLKASLHARLVRPAEPAVQWLGSQRRFTTTFTDGVVFSIAQPDSFAKPLSTGTQSFQGTTTSVPFTPRGGDGAVVTPMSGTIPVASGGAPPLPSPPLAAINMDAGGGISASEGGGDGFKNGAAPFVFDPCIPSNTTICVTKNNFALSVDESKGDVSFHFSKRGFRRAIVYGLTNECLTSSSASAAARCAVVPSVEFEISRTIDNQSGTVHRFFGSGAQQSLFADGSVATRLSPTSPWLLTTVDGTRYLPSGVPVEEESSETRSKCATDRERSCRIRSRSDGVVIAEYFSPPSLESHTRVTAHADGTVIVTLLDAQVVSSTVMENLYLEVQSLASFGQCSFVVESPNAPRVFLFTSLGPLNSFYVQLGDNSVLERHVMPPQTTSQTSYMQTVFCRGTESTLRYNHDSALMFVEPHDVHLAATNPKASSKPGQPLTSSTSSQLMSSTKMRSSSNAGNALHGQSMNSVAICEAIAVFDLALGGMRLVDRENCVTTVSGIFDFSEPDVSVEFERRNVMELLLLMLPVGYQTHARSKRVLGEIAQAAEDEAGDDADTHSSSSFPSLLDRLRLLAQQFVIDNRLIQQESLRRSNHDSKNSRKQPMDSTSTHGGHSDSDPSQSIRAKGASAHDDQNALARLLSNNVRPLLFVEMSPNSFDHIMCAADLAAFLRATNNKQWTVASSVCSGEPGIEQISFYRAAGGALLTPFESSALEPTAGTPWLPKSLQPPRRFVAAGLVGSSAMGSPATPSLPLPPGFAPVGAAPDFPLHGALRVLLRYAPLSSHARAAIVASHVNSQIQVAKMNRYAKSLQDAIGVENEATVAGLEMLWSRHGALISTAAAGGGTVSGSGQAIPVIEPSPERGSNDIPVQDKPPTDIVDLPMLSGKQQGTNATMVDENIVTFLPDTADFGPLVPGFSYLLPVTVQNNSSLTLLFEVFDPLPFDHFGAILPSFVSVKTHRFMISPYGTTLLNIVVALSPAGINTIRCKNGDDGSFRFDEVLRLTCHAVKRNFKLHVTGSANFASNANQALRTSVRVMEAAL